MKSKTYNGAVRSSEKDFETLQLGAFATPGLLLAQGPIGLTAESGFNGMVDHIKSLEAYLFLGVGSFVAMLATTLLLFKSRGWL